MTDRSDFADPLDLNDHYECVKYSSNRVQGQIHELITIHNVSDAKSTKAAMDPAGDRLVNVCRHIG